LSSDPGISQAGAGLFSAEPRSPLDGLADTQEGIQETKNEWHCCLCSTMRNRNVTRFESAPERSVGLCFRSLSLLRGHVIKRRGHELLFQFVESMRISGIMNSQSPLFRRGRCTRKEAQKQTTMALVMCRDCLAPMWASFFFGGHVMKSPKQLILSAAVVTFSTQPSLASSCSQDIDRACGSRSMPKSGPELLPGGPRPKAR
jgi:hypothetical protein